jgi:signal transduction histidine kinase
MIRVAVARRLARSPVVLDWLPVLLVPVVLIIDAALSAQGKPIGVINVLCGFVACAPLALRRHVSFPVLAPLIVGGVTLALWQLHPANTVVVIPMIALFELTLNGDRRRSLWMSLAIVPCVVISVIPFASGFSHITSIVIRNTALVLLAIAAAEVIRSRRVSEQRLVETAEQETLRRVGEERLRIAREIHDVVAHAMTAINVQAGVAAHLLERDPRQAYGALRNIKHTSGAALTDLRSTLDVLRDPSAAAPLGPPAGLGDIADLTGGLRSAGVDLTLDIDSAADVPAAVQSVAYRIVQEALTNVARHAQATSTTVSVRRIPGAITVDVIDDGAAAPVPGGAGGAGGVGGSETAGNGIRGMRERAAALGGTLEAGRRDGGGWGVHAWLPMTAPAPNGGAGLVAAERESGELRR